MGNVATKAAIIVQRVVKTIKDTFRQAARKAAEVVVEFYHEAKHTLVQTATKALTEVVCFSVNHPTIFKILAWTDAGASVGLVLAPICTAIVLPCIGFTGGGVAAGSLAAAWHAMIGNVAAGSLFAALTSAGMGGFGVALVTGAAVVIGAASGTAMAVLPELIGRGSGGPGFGSGLGIGPGPEPGPEPGFVTEIEDDDDQDGGDDKHHNHDRDHDFYDYDDSQDEDSKDNDNEEDAADEYEFYSDQVDKHGSWKQT